MYATGLKEWPLMMKFGLLIRYLVALTLILGVFTVIEIQSLGVPSFIVYSAIAILLAYFATLVWISLRESKAPLYLIILLSLLTMTATFSSTEHLQLIESGYLPAIFIIFGGFATQAALFVVSLLSLRAKTSVMLTSEPMANMNENESAKK